MLWVYKSPIGEICIKRLKNGRYGMFYDGTVWESSATPKAEADNVYCQSTGCSDWDTLDISNVDVPSDLSEWEKV